MNKYVVDTNILMLLENFENLLKRCDNKIIVPIFVIEELDNLKSKEGDRGFIARRALRNLEAYEENVEFGRSDAATWFIPEGWDKTKMDNRIVNYALELKNNGDNVIVISNDLNVRLKSAALELITANHYESVKTVTKGWTEIKSTLKQYVDFQEGKRNKWNIEEGQYIVFRDEAGHEIRGIYKFIGDKDWLEVMPMNVGNGYTGTVTPKDAYQQCAIDSLLNDQFTVITGKAGSGKTLLALTYALRELQSHKRDKLVIFTNPVKVRGSEQLGYYPGDRTEKLLQNSIGAMLSSKLGGQDGVDMLLDDERIEILPFSDIRGYEVGPKNIMYITEAQNLSVDLAKLAIQRCAEGSKIIMEGDPQTQVDHHLFQGSGSGLKRVIEVFEGYLGFSHVELPNIYRSKIADKAEEM